jgi:hypothetical protein
VIDKRNTRNEKNTQTQRDRNTAPDEVRIDGDDDDETGYSEDDHGDHEDGTGTGGDGSVSHSKRRQDHSFYFTTGSVKRMESTGCCTALPQVSHRPERQDQGSKGPCWCSQEPPDFMTLLNHTTPRTQEQRPTIVDTLNHPVSRGDKTQTYHSHTLLIVTDTHQNIDRDLYTYMTSYLDQAYRLSILIDKSTLFINSWLIRL